MLMLFILEHLKNAKKFRKERNMDIQFRGNTLSGDPAKHISYAVFINQQNKTLYIGIL